MQGILDVFENLVELQDNMHLYQYIMRLVPNCSVHTLMTSQTLKVPKAIRRMHINILFKCILGTLVITWLGCLYSCMLFVTMQWYSDLYMYVYDCGFN